MCQQSAYNALYRERSSATYARRLTSTSSVFVLSFSCLQASCSSAVPLLCVIRQTYQSPSIRAIITHKSPMQQSFTETAQHFMKDSIDEQGRSSLVNPHASQNLDHRDTQNHI